MRKEKTLLIIGLWVMFLPLLGFPSLWRAVLYVITGISLIYLAYLFYLEAKARLIKNSDNQTKTYVDNIEKEELKGNHEI